MEGKMSLVRKLKPDRNITGALVPLSMLPIFGLTSLIFGIPIGLLTLAVMVALIGLFYLYVFIRTWNVFLLVLSADCAFFVFMLVIASGKLKDTEGNFMANPFDSTEFALAYFTGLAFFGFVIIFLTLTRRLKWRGREIFELAAEPVEETGNGYTSRPRPVGKVNYSPQQMRAYTRFCSSHLIALPYSTSKNITLVLVKNSEEFGRLLGLSGDYRDATWVNFDVDGEVSVHIAQKDYLDYRQPLAFDQLCTSLGQVFIDFFDLYDKGEGVRVIDRLDDLKISVLS
jgi:hypothetical protein